MKHFVLVALTFNGLSGWLLAAAPETVRDGTIEKRALFSPAGLRTWSPAESTVEVSTDHVRGAADALHWHVTVDYNAGEAKYPIGWPRVDRNFPAGTERDWSGWDYLHCWIYTVTNRERLPGIPAGLGLQTPDRAGAYQRTLSELKAGEWAEIKIPVTQIARNQDVRNIQFHIAESNYRDGDQLDFYLSDLALVRYAVPTLLEAAPESAVLFADAAHVPVRVHLAGVAPGEHTGVVCELVREGRVAVRRPVTVARGVQTIVLELGAQRLAPGDYELRSQLAGQSQVTTARIRLIDSPWK